jgi:hypothetical protein
MRNTIYITAILFVLFGAGCENAAEPDPYDVVVDSAVTSRMTEHRARMSVRNDSILNALESARADSMAKVKGVAVVTKDTTVKKP